MNIAIIIGSVADVKMDKAKNGEPLLTFSVKDVEEYIAPNGEVRETTTWHKIQAWGRLAQLRQDLDNDELVVVEGRYRSFKTVKGDTMRVVVAKRVDPIGALGELGADEVAQTAPPKKPAPPKRHVEPPEEHLIGEDDDSSIPF